MRRDKRFSWIKDGIIQIMFISAAIVFTVMIAHMSITEQYSDYYRQQMEYRGVNLERNIGLLFESRGITDTDDMSALLAIIFPEETTDEARYEEFIAFSREMSAQLYESLGRGILIMAVGFVFFTVVTNVKKKNSQSVRMDEQQTLVLATGPGEDYNKNFDDERDVRKRSSLPKLAVQFFSMLGCFALALLLLFLQGNVSELLQTIIIITGGIFLGLGVAHIMRLLLWVISKRTGRSDSGYSAQTTQFCIFLMVFLSMFSFSMHNGFGAHLEANRLDEMRLNSVFASLSGEGDVFCFGEYTESFVIIPTEAGFYAFRTHERAVYEANNRPGTHERAVYEANNRPGEDLDFSHAYDLFASAWEAQVSLMGVRGDYKYGVTVMFDIELQAATAISVVRQPSALLAGELRGATVDFLLAMSASVFAVVFVFIELNKLLESINIPNVKRERRFRYAAGAKSLNFLVSVCQTIPTYFFVLIVLNIYAFNPVSWLPGDFAVVLPLAIVLIMMVAGGDIVGRFIRLVPRRMMILGCIIGAAGFLVMDFADNLFLWLLLLAVTYFGVSIVYMGLQRFISGAADTGYEEFRTLREETLSGEYLGGTSGAVVGAIVFAQFGLFAAFALSAAIMIILAVLIRCMLPNEEETENETETVQFGFFRFLFSKRILSFLGFLMAPFIVGQFFIRQFAPLYADSINMSPGAASWTYLLMTMAAAFAAPSAARLLAGRLRKTTICVFANLLSVSGLLLFSLFPGITTMYIASGLLGVSVGTGTNMVEGGFAELDEAKQYKRSGFAFKMFGAVFGQLGVVIFTLVYALSPGGEYVLFVAGVIAVPTIIYFIRSVSNVRTQH